MDEILTVSQFTLPFAVSFLLAAIFYFFTDDAGVSSLTKRVRNGIALVVGMACGLLILLLKWDAGGFAVTITAVVLHIFSGLLQGFTAVGIWTTYQIQSGKPPSGSVVVAPAAAAITPPAASQPKV